MSPFEGYQESQDQLQPFSKELNSEGENANESSANLRKLSDNTNCGFIFWYPKWIQRFAHINSFVVLCGIMGMFSQGMETYGNATLTSVEKRFKIPSATIGGVSVGWEVGNIFFILVVAYLGSRGHKPKWMAFGALISSGYCWIRMMPHYIYGPGADALSHTLEYGGIDNVSVLTNTSENSIITCNKVVNDLEECEQSDTGSLVACILFFLGSLVGGISTTLQYALGITYMDDNCKKDTAPVIIALTNVFRMFGPTIGYFIGSYVLSLYIDPYLTPTIKPEDPRWIGAWWLGYYPFGIALASLSILMFLFPKELPKTRERRLILEEKLQIKKEEPKLSFTDFKVTMKRLLCNKVLMYNSFSTVFYILGLIGYGYFMPKYLETQFNQSASAANLITGSVGLIFTAIGVLTSGFIISKWQPNPVIIAAWNVFTEILGVVGYAAFALIGCNNDDLFGFWNSDHSWNMTAECNANCQCGPNVKYSPVCWLDGNTTFYSACHAGCTDFSFINDTKSFSNCGCVNDFGSVIDGPCPVDCSSSLITFLILECVLQFFSSTGTAGNLILQFRCVSEEDKALSIGICEILISGLAFVPGPIMFGTIVDSACMVWGYDCGKSGNCWLYEGQKLKNLMNFTTCGLLIIAVILDIGVMCNVRGLKIYDKDVEKEINEKIKELDNKSEETEVINIKGSSNENIETK